TRPRPSGGLAGGRRGPARRACRSARSNRRPGDRRRSHSSRASCPAGMVATWSPARPCDRGPGAVSRRRENTCRGRRLGAKRPTLPGPTASRAGACTTARSPGSRRSLVRSRRARLISAEMGYLGEQGTSAAEAGMPSGPSGVMSVWDADPALGRVVLSVEQIARRVAELGKMITADYASRPPLLVGVLKGAFIFLADLAREIQLPLELDFMAVSSYGRATKTSGVVRILKDLDIDLTGRHVLVVEDILDSGLTLSYLRKSLLAR